MRIQEKGSVQAQESAHSSDALKRNRFYVVHSRGEKEGSPDLVIGMLHIITIDVNALLDPSATLSFVTLVVDKIFDVLPDILVKLYVVTTPASDAIVARRVFRNCPISLPNRFT